MYVGFNIDIYYYVHVTKARDQLHPTIAVTPQFVSLICSLRAFSQQKLSRSHIFMQLHVPRLCQISGLYKLPLE